MSTAAPLRFGILGAARIAPPALILPAREVPDAEVVAVAARDAERARRFAAEFDIPRGMASYEALLECADIDAVYNALPNGLHAEWSIRALRAGKHVLCEKPLASNAAQAEEMARVAEQTGLVLAEAFHYRYHPLAARIRGIFTSGVLGRLRHLEGQFTVPFPSQQDIRFDFSLAGGATMDLGCYPLQMLRYFPGETPTVVRAEAQVGPVNIDVAMDVELAYASGASGRMLCSMASDSTLQATFQARGDKGELHVMNPVGPHFGHLLSLRTEAGEQNETVDGQTTYFYQLCAFVAAVRGVAAMPTDTREGVRNMALIDAVYRAAGLPLRGTGA